MDGYGVQIVFQEALQSPVIACGVDATRIWQTQTANPDAPHSALVIAFNLDGLGATFADVVELAGLTMLDPDISAVGGEIAASVSRPSRRCASGNGISMAWSCSSL